jgi:uncharacterized protein YjbI with pentapeptide repeats
LHQESLAAEASATVDATDQERLRQAAERSTTSNRTYFVSFLIILAYLLIIIASTTDHMLLVPGATVRLPFVDTEVSLLIFYFSAPLIVLTAHFNLLQNLESHNVKLMAWQAGYPDGTVPRYLIDAFIYDLALLEREGQLTRSVRIFAGLLFQLLAPATLLVLLWRFSDYQSFGISGWHFACLLFDLVLIGYFQRAVRGRWRLPKTGWIMLALGGMQYGLLGYVLRTNDFPLPLAATISDQEAPGPGWLQRKMVNVLNGEFASLTMPRIDIDSYTSLTLDDKQPKLRMTFDGASDFASWFLQSGVGLDLRNRSLIGASLKNADLRKAILEGSDLQGANLSGARLAGANLRHTRLQDANLSGAQLQGATMQFTQLQGATLYGATLQGADLSSAQLQGANLTATKLQGANFGGAELQGAIFNKADPRAWQESEAKLSAAIAMAGMIQQDGDDDSLTILQGARMSDAQLLGARFNWRTVRQTIQKGSPDLEKNVSDWHSIEAMSERGRYKEAIKNAKDRTLQPGSKPHLEEADDALSKALPDLCANSLFSVIAALKSGHPDPSDKPSENLIKALNQLPQEPACKPYLAEVAKWMRNENITLEPVIALDNARKGKLP